MNDELQRTAGTRCDLGLSTDLATVADGLEAATLVGRGMEAGSPGTVVHHALRRAVTTHEAAASEGRYTASDVTWHLPVAEAPVAPRLGDVLRDAAGRRWMVLDVARTTLGSRWRCATRSLAIVMGLDDTITVLRASYAKGDGGAMEPTWQPWKTGIRARIQPTTTRSEIQHDARVATIRCTIYVEEVLSLDPTYRIQGPDGLVYKVVSTTGPDRIGELQSIEAEVTPWP